MQEELAGKTGDWKLLVVLPTFDRPVGLSNCLRALTALRDVIDEVHVIDNGTGDAALRVCQAWKEQSRIELKYTRPESNVGPAGATALAMRGLLESHTEGLVLRLDDDRPVATELFRRLLQFALSEMSTRPEVAAVGLEGAQWFPLRARLHSPRRTSGGPTPVDYLKTSYFPLFRFSAIRSVGPFRADLFFGMTEVEYGLRLRRAGWELIEASHLRAAEEAGRPRPALWSALDWRRYYSLRNLLVILRESGHPVVALRVAMVRGVLKPSAAVLVRRAASMDALLLSLRAVSDAYRGRMGATVDPALFAASGREPSGDRSYT